MKFYEEKDYDALSRRAANIIAAQMTLKPDCVLGLPQAPHRSGPTNV